MNQYHSHISPLNDLNKRLETIDLRVNEAADIFKDKFQHIDKQLAAFMQIIDEDKV
jgi:hypothetical protein